MKKTITLILFALLAFGQTAWAQQTNVNYIDANGEPQTASAFLITSSNTTLGMQGYDIWYYVEGNVEINSQVTYISNINLILCDGASLTVNSTDEDAIHCSADNSTLTIYGQTNGTGQLTATATSSSGANPYTGIYTEYFTINGGVINASGPSNGIYANKTLVINRGTVTANGNDWGMRGDVVTINGGNVTANGGGIWSSGMTSTLTVGYTNSSDRIYSTRYKSGYTGNTMMVKDGQYMITTDSNFIIYGYVNDNWKEAIAGHTLMLYTPTEWSGSGDSASDPYIIASVDDLNLLSLRTNGGQLDYSGKYFRLDADLNFTASTDWDDVSTAESNFTAISIFDGHFNGNSHSISGLRLHTSNNFVEQKGLFNYLGQNAYIENLTISNARIAGGKQVGAIVGYAQEGATIINCHVTGNVAIYAYGHTLQKHGGIVGYNDGTVSNCVSEVTISRSIYYAYGSENVGGIAGYNAGSLLGNIVFNADITAASSYGAIAGLNDGGTLSNNYYHACTVNGTANTVNIGVNGADITTSDGAMSIHTITKPNDVTITTEPTLVYGGTNYWKHGITITLNGGLDGTPTDGWQKAYYINGVALQENSTTISHTFDMPAEDIEITIGEIHADWAISNAGTEADPYKIYFTDQLDLLATRVNNGTSTYSGNYFKLMDNLTYSYNGLGSDESNYTPIGFGYENNMFMGHFDGNNKIVSGIRIRKTGTGIDACYLGLFGSTKEAEVKDVIIQNSEIIGHKYLGGVVGHSWSTMVSGCHVWNNVTIVLTQDDSNTAGGIAGHNDLYQSATITNCISEVRIITNTNSHCYNIGGIVGLNDGEVSNCFVMSAYIGGGSQVGAIVGAGRYQHALSNNYYRNCVVNNASTNVGCDGADVTDNDGALGVYSISINAQDVILSSSNEPMVTYQGTDYWKSGLNIELEGGLNGTPAPGFQKAYFINGEALTENTFVMPANDVTVTVGEIHADWETANAGTEDDPYLIYFTDQLDFLASRTNNDPTKQGYVDKYFKLMNDLTYSYEGLGATESNYTPIGGYTNHFYGHFDGNNKTISGIRIYKGGTSQAVDDFLGLFGYIDYWYQHEIGDVKNLTLDDAVITGNECVGGIVGRLYGGTVDNCHVTSSVIIHTVVDGADGHGGIVGDLTNHTAAVSNCTSSVTLTVDPEVSDISEYGGIVGCCYSYCTLTDNFAIGVTVPGLTGSYNNGAITGAVSYGILERNYYLGCKVGSENVTPSGVGCGGYNVDPYDIIENDGAVPVFTLSLASGISADVDTTLTHNEVNYYKLGTSVSLSYVTPAAPGYRHIYSVNGWPIEGNIFYMDDDAEVTVAPNQLIDFEEHQGSEDDPYLIYYKEQWDLLAERVNGTNDNPKNYSGKFFKLMEDISITEMVGGGDGSNNIFSGTFDGNGHTITFNAENATEQYIAPFRRIDGATIMGVKLEGTVSSSNRFAGGIVAYAKGTSTVTNCINSTNISTVNYNLTDSPSNGGIVGMVGGNGTINISGCVFNGQMHGTQNNNWCGILGLCNGGCTANISNCFFAPEAVTLGSGNHTIYRNNGVATTPTNCYYTQAMGTNQGDKVYTITPAEPVTVQLLGDAEVYDVSGITIYGTGNKGLKFDDVFYAASGNVLDLNLGVTVPFTVANYLANGYVITFDNTGNNYILTMSDVDVTITATFSDVAWEGEGTEESPYLIFYNVQWDLLATNVNAGNNYNGMYFKLMDDISVETMVGSTDRPFRGIFDGGGHTLTFNKGTEASPYDQNFCAPFRAVEAATIKNLHTTGAIYTSKQHAAGFVAQLIPNTGNFTRFISCRSSMKINSTVASDARTGGFIGSCSDAIPSFTQVPHRLSIFFEDCLFDGEFSGTATGWGGFVGYYFHCESEGGNSGMVDFTRCLFAPSAMNIDTTDAYNFVRSDVLGWSGEEGAWIHAHHSYPSDVMTRTKLYYTITCGNLEVYTDDVEPTPVGNMTNVQLRNALGDNWMIVTEEAVEKVVPTMGLVVRVIEGYGDSTDKWAFIASPVSGSIAPTDVDNLIGNAIPNTDPVVYDFDLYRFNPNTDLEWENYHAHTSDFNIVNGTGYLYATKTTKTLAFTGTFNTGTSKEITNLPAGFNLVGNPFTVDAYVNKPYYTLNSDGSAIVAKDSNDDQKIAPCHGVIVEVGENETVTFNTSGEFSTGPNNGSLQIALSQANTRSNAVMDNAIVSFNEGEQLGKFYFGTQDANIYLPQNGKEYAIAYSEGQGEMPLNFKGTENGTYTLSINPEGVEMAYLHLVDNLTGNDIDLLAGASTGSATYTFTAKTTDYESRFKLVFASIFEDADGDNEAFAFISNGNIIVNGNGTLQVIDMTGRVVRCADVARNVSTNGMASGVYVLRLINGNDVKTQKIVVE